MADREIKINVSEDISFAAAKQIAAAVVDDISPQPIKLLGWWDNNDGDHHPAAPSPIEMGDVEELAEWWDENVADKATYEVWVNDEYVFYYAWEN